MQHVRHAQTLRGSRQKLATGSASIRDSCSICKPCNSLIQRYFSGWRERLLLPHRSNPTRRFSETLAIDFRSSVRFGLCRSRSSPLHLSISYGSGCILFALNAGTPVTRELWRLALKGGFYFKRRTRTHRFALSTTTVIEKVTSDISWFILPSTWWIGFDDELCYYAASQSNCLIE